MKNYQKNKLRRKVFTYNREIETMISQAIPILGIAAIIILFYSL